MRLPLLAVLLGIATAEAASPAKVDEVGRAHALLSRRLGDVKWRPATAQRADVTLDGKTDVVMLGVRGTSVVMAVVAGPVDARSRHWVLTFEEKADALCAPASDAVVQLEALELPLDEWGCTAEVDNPECERARALEKRFATARQRWGSRGLGLVVGACDAFHIHFDGKQLAWWRR